MISLSLFRVLLTLVVIVTCLLQSITTSASCPPHERSALLQFKQQLIAAGDPAFPQTYSYWFSSWANPGNSSSHRHDDCCQWKGVTCGHDDPQAFVIGIALNNCYWNEWSNEPEGPELNGTMKPEALLALAALSRLSRLDLGCQGFNGSIPTEIGSLTSLAFLNLTHNNFSGNVLESLHNLSLLQHLDLSYNRNLHSVPPAGDWSPSFQLHTLDLSFCNFSGSFPSWLRYQTNISSLSILGNKFSGEIPSWAWRLANHSLDFSFNDFSHTFTCDTSVPSPLPSLVKLHASGNPRLSGTIPCFIANLTSLQTLYLDGNSLTGSIPADLFANTLSLTEIDLSLNQLEGGIPSSLLQLPSLSSLALYSNHFTGAIPDVLMNLTRLQSLYLSHNHLNGLLPPSMQYLKSLETLDLDNNKFHTQRIPHFLLQLPSLVNVFLSSNNFVGHIADVFANLTNIKFLTFIDLSFNSLTGPIPDVFRNLTRLESLDLSHNKLEGVLPPSMQYLNSLAYLDLSSNNFTGPIPDVFNNLTNLNELHLSHNLLNGLLPPSMRFLKFLLILNLDNNQFLAQTISPCLFFLPSLLSLDLSFNNFTGIRAEMSAPLADAMPNLAIVNLQNNRLCGPIPSFIQSLLKIQVLHLGSNDLNGSIPEWIGSKLPWLRVLVLAGNSLTGSLPPTLGLLRAMQTHVDPSTIGIWNERIENMTFISDIYESFILSLNLKGQMRSLSDLQFFTFLDLSANRLSGPIPPELGKLKCLRFLNVSGNSLEGEVPSTLGELTNLESLDLSRNMLGGHIPTSFNNLHELDSVNLSSNHLSGSIPSSPQWLDTFNENSFLANDGLCIPSSNALARLPLCSSSHLAGPSSTETDGLESQVEWSGFVVGYSLGLLLGILLFNSLAGYFPLTIFRPNQIYP